MQLTGGYVAYDVQVVVDLEGDINSLSDLTLVSGSLEPSNCSIGDEEYTAGTDRVALSRLSVLCTAKVFLTAKVSTK